MLSILSQGRVLNDALKVLATMDDRDQAFSRVLVYGACRWYFSLQGMMTSYLKKPFKQKDKDLEVILVLGLYQLLILKTDHHAAVHETVKLARWCNKDWAAGLVNAILRQVIKDRISMDDRADANAYPKWMYDRFMQDWPQALHSLLKAGNEQAPMSLRLDIRQLSMRACLQRLAQQSIPASPHDCVDTALLLETPCCVEALPGFAEGILSVQDSAAQLAVPLLACQPGMRVLDACAAPGGKTLQILQSTDALQLTALDLYSSRLNLIAENLERAGQSAQLICGDAARPAEWFDGQLFDRILADVPCSASGVIRRHPDIKLLRHDDDVVTLVKQQKRILSALWTLLKPGGLLVYSTCSIFKAENEYQIDWFMQKYTHSVVSEPISATWGEQRPWGRQILPGSQQMDGFYYVSLQKANARYSA